MTDHPITPPPELVGWWRTQPEFAEPGLTSLVSMTESRLQDIATQAARWGADQQVKLDAKQIAQAYQKGADQELEACCEWLRTYGHTYEVGLRASRRPKPPSLKEQALARLTSLEELAESMGHSPDDTIRRALNELPDN